MQFLEVIGSIAIFILMAVFMIGLLALFAKFANVTVRTRSGTPLARPDTLDNLFKKPTRDLSGMILIRLFIEENISSYDRDVLLSTDPDEVIIDHKRKVIQRLYAEKAISTFEKQTIERELVKNGSDSPFIPF